VSPPPSRVEERVAQEDEHHGQEERGERNDHSDGGANTAVVGALGDRVRGAGLGLHGRVVPLRDVLIQLCVHPTLSALLYSLARSIDQLIAVCHTLACRV